MEKETTNSSLCKDTKHLVDKLPEELRVNYRLQARECLAVVGCLKVAAALKLWVDRGYRDVKFDVPIACRGKKTVFVDVVAKDEERAVGVECMHRLHLGWLRWRIAQLRRCLPADSYLVVVFPFGVDDRRIDRAVELVDEVWVTGKDSGKVERMMFTSVFHRG